MTNATHAISGTVDRALPTVAERYEEERKAALEAHAKQQAALRRQQDAELDKIRHRLQAIQGELQSEPELREAIKALTLRYSEQAAEAAQLDIHNRIEKLLGEPANPTRKARIESLEAQNKVIEQDTIPKQVKRLREIQKQVPELEAERSRLRRQLEGAMPVYF